MASSAWIAVVNAQAGSSDEKQVDAALDVLKQKVEVEVRHTADKDDLADAVRAARGSVVAVLGGDGSLNAVVSVLDMEDLLDDVTVALVPLGTGNDYARTIGVSPDPERAAQQALDARPSQVDLIRDGNGRIVVNAAHVGLGVEATEHAKPWKKVLGPVGYAIGATVTGVVGKGKHARVWIDGDEVQSTHRLLQVAVGNGRHIGGGAPIFPDADPADGLLDVAVSWSEPRLERLSYVWRLRRGRHPTRDDVVYRKAHEVLVRGESLESDLDGEICVASTEHSWRIEPDRLRILRPGVAD